MNKNDIYILLDVQKTLPTNKIEIAKKGLRFEPSFDSKMFIDPPYLGISNESFKSGELKKYIEMSFTQLLKYFVEQNSIEINRLYNAFEETEYFITKYGKADKESLIRKIYLTNVMIHYRAWFEKIDVPFPTEINMEKGIAKNLEEKFPKGWLKENIEAIAKRDKLKEGSSVSTTSVEQIVKELEEKGYKFTTNANSIVRATLSKIGYSKEK